MEHERSSRAAARSGTSPAALSDLIGPVTELLRSVADEVIRPRFGHLAPEEITEKDGAELTTAVDVEAEAALSSGLRAIAPGVPVVGEEAASADPSLLDLIGRSGQVWLVDPVDGTSNFADGAPGYGTIIGLLDGGDVVAAWSWNALDDAVHVLGPHGVERHTAADTTSLAALGDRTGQPRVIAKWWYLPESLRRRVRSSLDNVEVVKGPGSAASEYPMLLDGSIDALLYGRTRAWDHAPGCAMVRRVGGVARRLDGHEYRTGVDGVGLLVARSPATWERVRTGLDL